MPSTFQPPPTYAEVVLVDEQGKPKFNPIWLAWFLEVAQFFSTAAIHNELSGLQGGAADEYYHLDTADYAALASVLSTYASGLTTTITTAPLTGLGAPGSMTFTNGILTAETPAT